MAARNFPNRTECLDRRRFLAAALTAVVSAGVGGRITEAKAAEIIRVPRRRPNSDIEGWNLGLISAPRPELTAAENRLRMGELLAGIGNRFGRFQVRGRYIPMPGAEPVEQRAFLVVSKADDSGNLKGFLRKVGRKFGHDAVIYKGYGRDVLLFALKDLSASGMKNGEAKSLGYFDPDRIAQYHALMTRNAASAQFSAVSIGWCRKSTPWLILSSAARAAGGHISVRSLRTPELQRALRTKLKRPN